MENYLQEDSLFVLLGSIFAVYMAIRAWTKGAMELLWAVASWGAGISAGMLAYSHGPGILDRYAGLQIGGAMEYVVSGALAVVAFAIVRMIAKTILTQVFGPETTLGGWMYGASGGILSFIPTAAILLLIMMLVRMNGTIWEMNQVDKIARDPAVWTEQTYPDRLATVKWRNGVEGLPQGNVFLDFLDPVTPVARRNLVMLLLAGYHSPVLAKLQAHPSIETIANNAEVLELLENNPDIQTTIASEKSAIKYWELLRHREVRYVLSNDDLRRELSQLDMAAEIKAALIKTSTEKRIPWLKRIFS